MGFDRWVSRPLPGLALESKATIHMKKNEFGYLPTHLGRPIDGTSAMASASFL